jgi:hypothetical protein
MLIALLESILGAALKNAERNLFTQFTGNEQENNPFFGQFVIPAAIDAALMIWREVGDLWRLIERNHDAILAAFTIGIFTVTYLLARYTRKLWSATTKLVEEADRSSKKELRAYVSVVVGSAVYQEREKNLRFEGKPLMVNTGRTPAYKSRI